MISGAGCTELNERMKKSGLHTGPHVYHQADQGGLATVPVLNLTDRAMTLCPGLGLGTFEHAGIEEVQARPGKVRRPTTAKQKKEEYLRQLINNAKEVKRKGKEKQGFDAAKATTAEKEAWLIRIFDLRSKPCLAKPKSPKRGSGPPDEILGPLLPRQIVWPHQANPTPHHHRGCAPHQMPLPPYQPRAGAGPARTARRLAVTRCH